MALVDLKLGPEKAMLPVVFPLSVSANGRYLKTPSGVPFRIQSEFNWVMSTQATSSQVLSYLDDRYARGFNAFEMMAIVQQGGFWNTSRANQNGDEPFTTINDLSTANDNYFDFIEFIVDKAATRNMMVLLYLCYAGFDTGGVDPQGWYEVVAANTLAKCQAYGTYMGTRFGGKPNIMIMYCGDRTPPNDGTLTKYKAIFDAYKASASASHLCGSEWNFPDMLVTDQVGFTYGTDPTTSDMQVDTFYAQGGAVPRTDSQNGFTYISANRSWGRYPGASGGTQDPIGPILPGIATETMQADGTYAYISFPTLLPSDRASIRKYQHWAITSGSIAGSNHGQVDLANTADYTHLNDLVFKDQQYLFSFYNSLPWWLMVPSGTATNFCGRDLIVSGLGSGNSCITSCVASDGSCLLAYVPSTGTGTTTFSVDFRSMRGTSTAEWWNPLTNNYTAIGGTFANSLSSQSFTTPSAAGRPDSSNDWMLVVQA